jgi:hypothetical protein
VGYRCGRVALYERNYCLQVDSSQKHAHLSPNAPRAPRKLHVPGSNAVEIKPRADRRALIGCAASVRSRCAVSVARTTRSLASDNCLDAFRASVLFALRNGEPRGFGARGRCRGFRGGPAVGHTGIAPGRGSRRLFFHLFRGGAFLHNLFVVRAVGLLLATLFNGQLIIGRAPRPSESIM